MRADVVIRYVGLVMLLCALFMAVSAAISAFTGDTALLPLIFSALVTGLMGLFPLIFVPSAHDMSRDEALAVVVCGWLVASIIGTLPYILWGGPFTLTNAVFESVSGFTTTGSTILSEIESLPRGLLFWRSTTHFIGGIGIVVFMLAIAPAARRAAMILYRSEMSPLAADNFQYRTRHTLQILLVVYLGLNLLQTLCLMAAGMNLFDALTHSFATVATGGFSTKNASVAYFNSAAVDWIIIVFMVLSGIHFGLVFSAVTGNPGKLFSVAATRYYVGAMVVGTVIVTISLLGSHLYAGFMDALRYAAFNLASVGTSTGFATADTESWPGICKLVLIFFSLQCAMAGSTSGGIKADRMVLLFTSVRLQIRRIAHPRRSSHSRSTGPRWSLPWWRPPWGLSVFT